MAVMVRCTGCRGASQVGADALGMLVQCPLCQEPFLALEEAAVVPKAIAKPRFSPAPSSAPAPRKRRKRQVAELAPTTTEAPDPHDAPLPSGGLPVSVLIGLALLPLAIPLLWLIGPQLLAKPPALTLAAPASLAIAASTLCLAVVFTVDWSPMTRIKGVLILVGLSYFAGLSLYFLKREVVDRAKDFFSPPDRWSEVASRDGSFTITAPSGIRELRDYQPLPGWRMQCTQSANSMIPGPQITFTFGSGPDTKPNFDRWFEEVGQILEKNADGGTLAGDPAEVRSVQGHIGEQWIFTFPRDRTRIVRVFRENGRVFYLAAEADALEPESLHVKRFFDSFRIGRPPAK